MTQEKINRLPSLIGSREKDPPDHNPRLTPVNPNHKKELMQKKRHQIIKKCLWIEIFLNFEMGGPLPRRPFLGPYFDECIFD